MTGREALLSQRARKRRNQRAHRARVRAAGLTGRLEVWLPVSLLAAVRALARADRTTLTALVGGVLATTVAIREEQALRPQPPLPPYRPGPAPTPRPPATPTLPPPLPPARPPAPAPRPFLPPADDYDLPLPPLPTPSLPGRPRDRGNLGKG